MRTSCFFTRFAVAVGASLFSASVLAQSPEDSLDASRAAIVNALAAGAQEHAAAPFRAARDKARLARAALASNQPEQAMILAGEASELAQAAELRALQVRGQPIPAATTQVALRLSRQLTE